jgi:hypothetical protein
VVRPATSAEEEEIWASSSSIYRGYQKYRERISNRPIRLFVLEASS